MPSNTSIGTQRLAVTDNNWLAYIPVLVIDFGAISGRDSCHSPYYFFSAVAPPNDSSENPLQSVLGVRIIYMSINWIGLIKILRFFIQFYDPNIPTQEHSGGAYAHNQTQ